MKITELKGAPKTPEGWAEYAKKAAQWRSMQPNDHKDPKIIAKADRRTDYEMKARQKAQGAVEENKDPCWKNYKQVGMKTKGGKQVPNCVPVEEGGMGGINRAAPAYDVSYEDVLNDVYDKWRGQKTKALEETELDEGWKNWLAGAALAGAALTGAGAAHAGDLSHYNTQYLQQVASGNHPRPLVSVDDAKAELEARANGKQQASSPEPTSSQGFSKEYLEKAADPNRFGRFLISVERAQELLKNMQ